MKQEKEGVEKIEEGYQLEKEAKEEGRGRRDWMSRKIRFRRK